MGRSPCCSKEGLNRGAWTAHEDKILREYIRVHGEGKWRNLPKRAGLKRCGKSCRLRWLNYLRPDIKRGNISSDEEELIIRLHNLLGNRWSLIAGRLPGRTDNEIKNYWNTNLGKKVKDLVPQQQQNNTCSAHQPNHVIKSTENPKPRLTTTVPPFPTTLPMPNSHHVVRTKATKCSKVLLMNSTLPHSSSSSIMQLQNKSETATETATAAEATPLVVSDQISEELAAGHGFLSSSLSFPIIDQEKELSSTTDFLIDFNVGDICLSELLNSDFTNMCNFSYGNEPLSPCSNQPAPPMFCDEVLMDWTQNSNFAVADDDETNVSNNFHSLTSFLESSDDEILRE